MGEQLWRHPTESRCIIELPADRDALTDLSGSGLLDQVMKPVPIHKAKASLSKLIERALAGEEVIIARRQRPVVRLVAIDRPVPQRKFGAMRGKISLDDTFFDPLPEAELDGWE